MQQVLVRNVMWAAIGFFGSMALDHFFHIPWWGSIIIMVVGLSVWEQAANQRLQQEAERQAMFEAWKKLAEKEDE